MAAHKPKIIKKTIHNTGEIGVVNLPDIKMGAQEITLCADTHSGGIQDCFVIIEIDNNDLSRQKMYHLNLLSAKKSEALIPLIKENHSYYLIINNVGLGMCYFASTLEDYIKHLESVQNANSGENKLIFKEVLFIQKTETGQWMNITYNGDGIINAVCGDGATLKHKLELPGPKLKNNSLKANDSSLIDIFMSRHKKVYNQQKSVLFFGSFRRSRWDRGQPETHKEIISHAQRANNRTRQICVDLGWMDRFGNVITKDNDNEFEGEIKINHN